MKMKKQPNIVFVLTDDQGYGDLGCTGNSIVQTPNINQFYEKSVRFTNYHVGPTCAPTRSGLMTGHYANSTGVWHTIGGRSLLRKNEWTLASALQESGYRTAIFGKWHLGDASPYRPQDRGFETTVVHGGGGISQVPDYWGNDYFDDTYYVNGEPHKYQGYCTDVFFSEALKYIETHKAVPFFCFIATNAPHAPYNVEKKYYDLYKDQVPDLRARFYGMITNIDENFGRLREKLRELELEDNTILIFMTDNGSSEGATLDKDQFVEEGYNAGLRGMKNSSYDGGHRVPFFMHWPEGEIDQGFDVNELTANVDFMPTLLDLCGISVPEGRSFHGKSVSRLLFGQADVWEERVMVTDSQRLTQPVKWRESAVMTQQWRLINGKELYDIAADREQRHDIAAEHQQVVEDLREEYEKWWDLVSTQFEEEIPISIGNKNQKETVLTCHDWRNEDCFLPHHQGQIRQGMEANGYWEIEVEEEGMYRFELRRWPREADREITSGIEGDDIEWSKEWIPEKNWELYTSGKALSIKEARFKIGDKEYIQKVGNQDKAITFTVSLSAGSTHLQNWFMDQNEQTIGVYYVYVRQV